MKIQNQGQSFNLILFNQFSQMISMLEFLELKKKYEAITNKNPSMEEIMLDIFDSNNEKNVLISVEKKII